MIQASVVFCEGLLPNHEIGLKQSPLQQLQSLLNESAFWAKERRLEDLEIAITCSAPVISAWDQDRLVGFARATSDGVYRATIWDVVVHPNYRGQGLGRQLVETVLAHPRMCRVERVYLTTTYQQAFYEKIGFEENGTTTMVRALPEAEPSAPQLIQSLVSQL